MRETRPTWAEISRGRLQRNFTMLRRLAPADAELTAVIKANAYGHGLAGCAGVLLGAGARWLGVTSVEEAVALRAACRGFAQAGLATETSLESPRILVMSGLFPGEAEAALEHNLTPAVWEPTHLDWLEAAARKRGTESIPVHLEIDTGMSRQGIAPEQLPALLERFGSPLRIEAVMTHFHSPDDAEITRRQAEVFACAAETIAARGLQPDFLSAGSSATVLEENTETITDLARRLGARRMLRPGLALYGYAPPGEPDRDLEPVLEWKTRITGLREIEAGTTAGYDGTFRATRRTRLALIPIGYADGLSRLLSNRGSALVRGQRAALAGRISMDQTLIDVTDIPGVSVGDEVVLIGRQDGERISAHELAALTQTICWEVLCAISARVPRVMVD